MIRKDLNLPNSPQVRPIERFWAHLKSKVFDRNWEAKNTDQLKRKIVCVSKTFDAGYFQ